MKRNKIFKLLSLLLSLIIILQFTVYPVYSMAEDNNYFDETNLTPPFINEEQISLFSIQSIISMNRDINIDSIVAKAKELTHSGFNPSKITAYETVPSLTSPYSAGSLKQDDINDALNALKMVRYITGLPYESVVFDNDLNNLSQHGAVLLASSNQFAHEGLTQPNDMDNTFFNDASTPFWETLKRKNLTSYYLIKKYKVSSSVLSRLRNNVPMTTNTLDNLCKILNCKLEEVAKYIPR